MESQPLDTMDALIKQLEGLRRDLRIQPPVVVRFALHGEQDENAVTINVVDDE
jgi:hypothetical protein